MLSLTSRHFFIFPSYENVLCHIEDNLFSPPSFSNFMWYRVQMLLEICYKNVDPLANICRREEIYPTFLSLCTLKWVDSRLHARKFARWSFKHCFNVIVATQSLGEVLKFYGTRVFFGNAFLAKHAKFWRSCEYQFGLGILVACCCLNV